MLQFPVAGNLETLARWEEARVISLAVVKEGGLRRASTQGASD